MLRLEGGGEEEYPQFGGEMDEGFHDGGGFIGTGDPITDEYTYFNTLTTFNHHGNIKKKSNHQNQFNSQSRDMINTLIDWLISPLLDNYLLDSLISYLFIKLLPNSILFLIKLPFLLMSMPIFIISFLIVLTYMSRKKSLKKHSSFSFSLSSFTMKSVLLKLYHLLGNLLEKYDDNDTNNVSKTNRSNNKNKKNNQKAKIK